MRYAKYAFIDGNDVFTRRDIHEFLSSALSFPEWYGHNLDALYDCLTCAADPVTVRIRGREVINARLEGYGDKLMAVLHDAAAENANVTVIENGTVQDALF